MSRLFWQGLCNVSLEKLHVFEGKYFGENQQFVNYFMIHLLYQKVS